MTLKEFISQKDKILTGSTEALFSGIENTQRQIFDEVLSLIDKLERKDGLIIISKSNLDIAAEINNNLDNIFNQSDFTEAVINFASEFEQAKKLNVKYFDKAFPDFKQSELQDAIYNATKEQAVEALAGSTVETGFLQGIKDQINESIISGSSFKDTVTNLREYALGSDQVDGKLLSYSKQIATDSIAIADRSFTNAIAEELDAEWFYYAGGEIDTTREFCLERHDKYFYYKEVEEWASLQWDGKNDTTTPQSIYIFAGGWNCSHSIVPVSVTAVPKTVINRNLKNGNFNPSEEELKIIMS